MNDINKKMENNNPFNIFVDGARKGLTIATTSTIPNVVMAFVLMQFLELTGILGILKVVFGPVMSIFGLPGEAIAILLATWLSMGGGSGAAASLYASGVMGVTELAIIFPAIYLMGGQVQFIGRILGTSGVQSRYYGIMITMSIVNAILSLFVMKIIVPFI